MKHAYSFLAGAALISLCVVATRSLPGWMFLLGYLLSLTSILLLCRVIGFGKVARFFFYLDRIRLAPPWSSGAKKFSATSMPSGSDGHGWVQDGIESRPKRGQGELGGRTVGCSSDRESRHRDSRERTGNKLPDVRRTKRRAVSGRPLGTAEESQHRVKEIPTRCNPSAARNEDNRSVVQSREMLPSVQQDVLSALINLKVPFAHAEEAVHSAAKEHGGESFDTLFRTALNLLNAGKSRRAAA